jgi:hypothetical protein
VNDFADPIGTLARLPFAKIVAVPQFRGFYDPARQYARFQNWTECPFFLRVACRKNKQSECNDFFHIFSFLRFNGF